MDFDGKVAIVTGGSRGIGKAISKALLNIGMKIVICDIDVASGKSIVEELPEDLKSKVIYQKCDMSSYEELKDAFKKAKLSFGRIDVVINNAGIINENQWKRMIDVNFIGVIHGIHLAFEFMGTNNGGTGGFVINTSSNAGLNAFELGPIYAGCKHGIVGLTRSYGQKYHFDKTGVTVNAVCPGPTETDLFYAFPKGSVDEERSQNFISQQNPESPDEVAKAYLQILRDGKNGSLLQVTDDGFKYAE